jgi:hypothetical protein
VRGHSDQQRAILTLRWDEYQRARLPGQELSSEVAFLRYGVPLRPIARAVAGMAPDEKWNRCRAASVSTSFRRLEIRGELRREGTRVRLTPSGVAAACRVAAEG